MEINFINGNVKDFREMLDVFEEVFEWEEKSKVDDNYISNILKNDNFLVLVAKKHNKVVGGLTAHILPNYETGKSMIYIYDLGVKTSFQNRGIGKKLIQYLIDYAKEKNFEEIFVATEQVYNEDAIAFYHKMPYETEMKVLQYNFII